MVSISYATLQNCAGASSDVNESIQLKNESVQFLSVGTSRSAHTSGKGCRKCTWGGYDCSKPGIVYYVRISHLGRYCYKIGVTNKSLKERYKNTDFNKMTLIKLWEHNNGQNAFDFERLILNTQKKYRYIGRDILSNGNSEIFIKDVLLLDEFS